jgi:cytochrome oxidase Cu insertion factor (SCO1/SenC/PrrC family)
MLRATTAIAALAIAAVVAACAGGADGSPAPGSLNGVVRAEPLEVGGVSLPDVTDPAARGGGRVADGRFTMAARDGRLLLVSFGFLNCPDVCPTTLADSRAALSRLDDDQRGRIDPVFVTVDPDRDGPDELADYLAFFFPMHHALRADGPDSPELRAALDAFLASAEVTVAADGTVEVAHTAVLYAVDDAGRVRVEWPFGTSADAIAADLRVLLAQSMG